MSDKLGQDQEVLPEATWICGNALQQQDICHFETAISNPPFGSITTLSRGPRSRQAIAEYAVIDAASDIADFGVFIVPQSSAGYVYSGRSSCLLQPTDRVTSFTRETNIVLKPTSHDTSVFAEQWRDVSPKIEVVTADFVLARNHRTTKQDLFERNAA